MRAEKPKHDFRTADQTKGDDEKFGTHCQAVKPAMALPCSGERVVRAHSLLAQLFRKWMRERTAVTGISWGGYLTCIVAAVDNRFPGRGAHLRLWILARKQRLARPARENDTRRPPALGSPFGILSQYLPAVSMPILFINGKQTTLPTRLDSYQKEVSMPYRAPSKFESRLICPMATRQGWKPQEIGSVHGPAPAPTATPRLPASWRIRDKTVRKSA